MCNVFQSYSAQIFHRVKSLFKYVFQMMRFKLSQHQLLLIRSLKEMSSGRRVKLIILTLGYNYNYQCLMSLSTIFLVYYGSEFYWVRKPRKSTNRPQLFGNSITLVESNSCVSLRKQRNHKKRSNVTVKHTEK